MPSEPPTDLYKYDIEVPVASIQGYQIFQVMATSEREALKSVAEKGEFVCEKIEAEGLDFDNARVL
jgi:hypothetical protein